MAYPLFGGGRVQQIYHIRDVLEQCLRAATFAVTDEFTRPLWFLPALFTANLAIACVFLFTNNMKKPILKIIFVLGLFLMGYLTNLPRYISSGLVGVIFLYAGYLFRKNGDRIPFRFPLFILSAIIVAIMSKYTTVGMMSNKYTNPFTLMISSACGIYCIIYLAKLIEKSSPFLTNHLAFYGRNTLIALAFHLLFFKLITVMQIVYYKTDWLYLACYPVFHAEWPWAILYSLIGFAGTYLIAFAKEQIMKHFKNRSLT